MDFLKFMIKCLVILATIVLMAVPFILEFGTFNRDKRKQITYKRFRVVVFTAVYFVAITIAMYLLKEFVLWLETTRFVRWLVTQLALSNRTVYFGKVIVAVLVNFGIGMAYILLSKLIRLGLKKKNLTEPKKKDGQFAWWQKAERKVIRFFYRETWFLVSTTLKYVSIALSVLYALIFIAYQIPAMFTADWMPYPFISKLFTAGYIYPTITLLCLWQIHFFLEGIKLLDKECPELTKDEETTGTKLPVDLQEIDAAVREEFRNFYVCDVDLSRAIQEALPSPEHHSVTKLIAQAVEADARNPQTNTEVYLQCLDKLVDGKKGLLINGNFFSEFSMYFLRYLSAVVARGDNVVFVCNTDGQIDAVYDYLIQGLSEISSLYCKGFQKDGLEFDEPIWRAVKVSGEHDAVEEASVDENNILVTSLSYLCSPRFENEHSKFISMIDAVVFVDTLNTVNTFNRQLAILNTRLKHLVAKNALAAKNGKESELFRVRYMSRQIRYICFDDTRAPGLDKVLKNMLAVDFDAADAMKYHPGTLVRCYCYEGKTDEKGERSDKQFVNSEEQIGKMINMAILCLGKGASSVSIFADDIIPYANFAETMHANMGQVSVKIDENSIRLNRQYYNPDRYSVIIAMDSGDNLPATVRRYASMVSDQPALIYVFARPYMLRDYYLSDIDSFWSSKQMERIPVEEGTKKDAAQRILVKANAGGISKDEVLRLAAGVPEFQEYAAAQDVNAILRGVLQVYGVSQEDRIDLFRYFEYTSSQSFDENGKYNSEIRIVLRRQGRLFELINGRDMVVLVTGDSEIPLPVPRSRLTQNYIEGQNFVHNGNIFHIQRIDTASGRIYARLAVSGKNKEVYRYIQDREYHVELSGQDEAVFQPKHVVLNREEEGISVSDVYLSVFRAPMEVVTRGYFDVNPNTLSANIGKNMYHSISDPGKDAQAKQTYRRYGTLTSPTYSSDTVMKTTNLNASENGALMMSIRMCGQFGPDVNKTMALAAAMLNELLHAMFPSVADSVVVCPVLHTPLQDEDAQLVMKKHPRVTFSGESPAQSDAEFDLFIIEDCATDLGVVSVLMSAGDDIMETLFQPVFQYLTWYLDSDRKDNHLHYGLDHAPACFDFASLHKLAKLLGDDKQGMCFVSMKDSVESAVCDFCGKRHAKDDITELDDGRKMCKTCAANLVGNDKKVLKSHLDRARIYLESTYGITLDDDYEFCFESTVNIVNTLKQNRNLIKRGSSAPLKSYVDDQKKVHVEYSIPSANLSELLVRELTHVWQLKHLPDVAEDLAEGHIALVGIQYLRFLGHNSLAAVRATYYESTGDIAGEGYRKLARALLENPQFHNNPFRYLLESRGGSSEGEIAKPAPRVIGTGELGLPYTPQQPDRVLNGKPPYFYYQRITATEQKVYEAILDAALNHQARFKVEALGKKGFEKVLYTVLYDHPEIFWVRGYAVNGTDAELAYGASAEECAVLQRRMDEVVPKYLEGIDDSMSAYDVALRIHAKIIAAVDYDTIALNREKQRNDQKREEIDYLRTICGVFLNGKAVCEGYARAMQYLLQMCGVECAEVTGNAIGAPGRPGGAHGWNILKVDGDYYYLDSTWDDSSDTVQTVKINDVGFDYFCITTEELTRSRRIDLSPTDMPICNAVRANYYYHNGLVLESVDFGRIKEIAQAAAGNKSKFFTFKCKSESVYTQLLQSLNKSDGTWAQVLKAAAKADKRIHTGQFSYTYDKHVWTITIKFIYK